jgi:hypothetical protein
LNDDKNVGRTWIDVIFGVSRKVRIALIVVIPASILAVFILSYWFAEPGETVSLFGIIKIKKSSQTARPIDLTDLDQATDSSTKKGKAKGKPDKNNNENNETGQPISPKATSLPPTGPRLSKEETRPHIGIPVKRHGISVLMTGKGQTINWELTHKIASIIEAEGGEIISNPALTSSFVSSGKFDRILKGNPEEITGLGAANPAAYLYLGKQAVVFRHDPNFEELITANASVKIIIISSNKGTTEDAFTVTGKGSGYTKTDAEKNALETILKNLPACLTKSIPQKTKLGPR